MASTGSTGLNVADLHDLEGAVGRVEELELLDRSLGNRVEGGATPAALHQADGLRCKTQGHKHRDEMLAEKEKKESKKQIKPVDGSEGSASSGTNT